VDGYRPATATAAQELAEGLGTMVLGPQPVQARALPTVARAIDATIGLIDEFGEERLRIQDVTVRSGVTNGSLMHHFGSREGLIAAALATRYDRSVAERIRTFGALTGPPEVVATGLGAVLVGTGQPLRMESRLARLRALSFARHRPELRQALTDSLRAAERALADRLRVGQASGQLVEGITAGALTVFAEASTVGMLVDGALLEPLPSEDWEAFFAVLLEAVVPPDILAPLRVHHRAGHKVVHPSPVVGAVRPALPALPSLRLTDDERRVLDHAVAHLARSGPETLRVGEVCTATGVSRGWFARHIGDREELIALARIDALIRFASAETAAYESAFDSATSVEELRASLGEIVQSSAEESFLAAAWDRLDLLVSASVPGRLAEDASAVVRAALERTSTAIADAQVRGVVRSGLEPCAVARFLWAHPVAFLLGDLIGVDGDELRALARRTNATLCAVAA
jgi:AcrR family transcriptional regulator